MRLQECLLVKIVRCLGCGFMETDEYGDCFASVCRQESCRAFFASAAKRNGSLCSIAVKSAFCTARINGTVHMNAPEGHKRPGFTTMLGRAIYGSMGCDEVPANRSTCHTVSLPAVTSGIDGGICACISAAFGTASVALLSSDE